MRKVKQNIVSFRYEVAVDLYNLTLLLDKKKIEYFWSEESKHLDGVEFVLENATIDDVFECMADVEDGHLMCDTIRPVPLRDNSLIKRYHGTTKPDSWYILSVSE